jgi:hypothetical protein
VRLELHSIPTQVSYVSERTFMLNCVVIDPPGREFTRQVSVGPVLPELLANLRWPDDYTSGDIRTGPHHCYWTADIDGTGEVTLGGTEFNYPAL